MKTLLYPTLSLWVSVFLVLGCVDTNPTTPKTSFLSPEHMETWNALKETHGERIKYLLTGLSSWIKPMSYEEAIKLVNRDVNDQLKKDLILAVIAYTIANSSPSKSELLAKAVLDVDLRDQVLVKVVGSYAFNNHDRGRALRLIEEIQGDLAKEKAYKELNKRY